MRNQKPYVLDRLRHAGVRGVHSWDLRREGIGNPSQRVSELEQDGHGIAHRSAPRDGCPGQLYTLILDAEQSVERHDTKQSAGVNLAPLPQPAGVVSLGAPAQGSDDSAPSPPTSSEPAPLFDWPAVAA